MTPISEQLISINPEAAAKKLSFFRRYFYEIMLIILMAVVSYLFIGQKNLERDMRNYLITDRANVTTALQLSTISVEKNTTILEKVLEVLLKNNMTLDKINSNTK